MGTSSMSLGSGVSACGSFQGSYKGTTVLLRLALGLRFKAWGGLGLNVRG